jgi:hypothetical protein
MTLKFDDVKQHVESFDYTLLSDSYLNNRVKLKYKCPLGHIFEMRFDNFKNSKQRCPICAEKLRRHNRKNSFRYVKDYIESENYCLLSKEYVKSIKHLRVKCPSNHEYNVSFNNFQRGCRCPICSSKTSKTELEVYKYICSVYMGEIQRNNRSIILNPKTHRYLELDIYLPDIKMAIEFNGEHWHEEDYVKWKDKIKQKQCKKNGITLLVIEYKHWKFNNQKCLNKIKYYLRKVK